MNIEAFVNSNFCTNEYPFFECVLSVFNLIWKLSIFVANLNVET